MPGLYLESFPCAHLGYKCQSLLLQEANRINMNYCSLFLTITHSFQRSLEQAFFTYLTSVSYSAYISPALHFVVIFLFILSLVKYSECKKAFLFFWRQKGVGSISAHIKILHNTLVPYTVSMLGLSQYTSNSVVFYILQKIPMAFRP